jgi:uncharacterized protein
VSRAAADAANQAAASWVKSNLADIVGSADVTVGDALLATTAEERNTAPVKQGYEAYGRGDIAALLALLDDQINWRTAGPPEIPFAGIRKGTAQVAQFFELVNEVADTIQFDARQFVAQGDQVVVLGDETIRVKATGRVLEQRWTHIFTVRGSKVTGFEEYIDLSALVAELKSVQAHQ